MPNEVYKKIKFWPTRIVTGQVFSTIMDRDKFYMITGQSGVGKTYAFLLYKLLGNYHYQLNHYVRHKKILE